MIVKPGFTYLIEVRKHGCVVDSEFIRNLMPTQGLDYVLGVMLKGAAVLPNWFIGLYEGNYTPLATDTAAAFPAAATETSAYAETTRQAFTPGTIVASTLDNAASVAIFTFNATKTVYGGFMASQSAKGATSGTLLSAVKFTSPKALDSGAVLRITAGFTMASA